MSHTIVLVHGAFAESASWDGVIDRLAGTDHHQPEAVAQLILEASPSPVHA